MTTVNTLFSVTRDDFKFSAFLLLLKILLIVACEFFSCRVNLAFFFSFQDVKIFLLHGAILSVG